MISFFPSLVYALFVFLLWGIRGTLCRGVFRRTQSERLSLPSVSEIWQLKHDNAVWNNSSTSLVESDPSIEEDEKINDKESPLNDTRTIREMDSDVLDQRTTKRSVSPFIANSSNLTTLSPLETQETRTMLQTLRQRQPRSLGVSGVRSSEGVSDESETLPERKAEGNVATTMVFVQPPSAKSSSSTTLSTAAATSLMEEESDEDDGLSTSRKEDPSTRGSTWMDDAEKRGDEKDVEDIEEVNTRPPSREEMLSSIRKSKVDYNTIDDEDVDEIDDGRTLHRGLVGRRKPDSTNDTPSPVVTSTKEIFESVNRHEDLNPVRPASTTQESESKSQSTSETKPKSGKYFTIVLCLLGVCALCALGVVAYRYYRNTTHATEHSSSR